MGGGANTAYLHNDLIGTLRETSNSTGTVGPSPGDGAGASRVYTAFGERVCQVNGTFDALTDRFGYAGAWGYQTHAEFPFLHVGARYYDPSSGRFLQRDPIGIAGGLNVYGYLTGTPTNGVDPTGLHDDIVTPPEREEMDKGTAIAFCVAVGGSRAWRIRCSPVCWPRVWFRLVSRRARIPSEGSHADVFPHCLWTLQELDPRTHSSFQLVQAVEMDSEIQKVGMV